MAAVIGADLSTVVVPRRPRPVIVIGEFDGVLPDSLATIDRAVGAAKEAGTTTLAVVLHDIVRRRFVMPPRRRCELLVQRGATQAVVLDVDGPRDVGRRLIAVADTFEDGAVHLDGAISYETRLAVLAALPDCPPVPNVRRADTGSDAVIAALDAGDVRRAAALLGRLHNVLVTVTEAGRGWSTADLVDAPTVVPAPGHYLAAALTASRRELAIVSIDATTNAERAMRIVYLEGAAGHPDIATIEFVDRYPASHRAES